MREVNSASQHVTTSPDGRGGRSSADRLRHISGRSAASTGTMKSGDGIYRKRLSSTATSDRPFERQQGSFASGKSLASVRTRLTSISRSEYHHDLKPSLQTGLTVNVLFTVFVIVFGSSFLFGYNIGVLNQPGDLIDQFHSETYRERYGAISDGTVTFLRSLTTSLFIPGGMFGAFLGGWLADLLGRKKTILFSQAFTIFGAIASGICVQTNAPEMLMLGRLLVGINSGIGNCLAPMFLTEIAPFNLRGAFGTVHQLSITIGIVLSSVFGLHQLLGTREYWPYLILLELIPAATSLCILPWLPETPRYLLLIKGDRKQAEKALVFYRQNADVSTDMEEMDTEHQHLNKPSAAEAAQTEKFSLGMLFRSPDLRKPLFIACALQVMQQFSGINAVFFYSKGIFAGAGLSKTNIPYAVITVNAVNVLMTIITVPLMDKAGRRKLLLYPMCFMIADLILITLALNLQSHYQWMAVVCVIGIIIYVIGFAVGLGPIPMMIGAELFRQGPRPKAMAVAGVVNWICTFIIALGFELVQNLLRNYTFLVFLVCMVLFTIFTYLFVPETKNKTFEEIAHQFSPGDHIEVEEVVDDVFGEDDDAFEDNVDDPEEHSLVTINFKDRPDSEKGAVSPGEADSLMTNRNSRNHHRSNEDRV